MKKLAKWRGIPPFIQKIVRVMKISVFLVLVGTLQLSASVMLGQQVSLQSGEMSVRQVFKELKTQTGTFFMYSEEEVDRNLFVDIDFSDVSLEVALDEICEQASLNYEIVDDYVLITKKAPVVEKPVVQQEKKEIKGTVTDENGDALPGVSVVVRETMIGTATDDEGNFNISVSAGAKTIVFSFIGMESQEVAYTGQESINVVLNFSTEQMNEVVVTGYQEIVKKRMVGTAITITAAEIKESSYNTISEVLQGKVPGMEIYTPSGAPGTMPKVRIRGTNSINGNNEPLWIVDGLPMSGGVQNISGSTVQSIGNSLMDNGIGNIHPQDIATITVLKDASASAIYGARAANGVVVITTKRGIEREPIVSYNGRFGISTAPNINNLNMMNSNQKVDFELELMEDWNDAWNAGRAGRLVDQLNRGQINRSDYDSQIQGLRNTNTDWFDEIFRTGIEQSHNVSIRGGGKKSTYYASINHRSTEGVLINNKDNNTGINIDLNFTPVERIRIGVRVNGNLKNNTSSSSSVDPFKYAVFANPYEKAHNADGTYAGDATYLASNTSTNSLAKKTVLEGFNILRELNENTNKLRGNDISASFRLEADLSSKLKAEVRAQYAYSTVYNETIKAAGTYTNYDGNWASNGYVSDLPLWYNDTYGSLNETNSYQKDWTTRGTLTYQNTFSDVHHLTVFAGTEWQSKEANSNSSKLPQYSTLYRIGGLPSFPNNPDLKYMDVIDALNGLSSSSVAQTRYVSFFGNMAYSYKDKYVLSFNMRSDGADIIGDGEKFSPLWSVGLRWNPLEESFIQNQNVFSQLSLRASYGFTGNIDRNAYPFATVTLDENLYNNNIVAKEFSYPNPNITWEKKSDLNLGFDFGIANDLITGSFNYYDNETTDLLGSEYTPNSYGRTEYTANVSSISNKGFDLGVNLNIKFSEKVYWQNSFNIGKNTNVLTKTKYKSIEDAKNYKGGSINIEGKAIGTVYGQKFAGVDPLTGSGLIWLNEKGKEKYAEIYSVALSDAPDKMRMNNGNSEIFIANLERIANTVPDFTGGFSSYFKYHNFDIRAFFSYAIGYDIQAFNDIEDTPTSASGNNMLPAGRLNRPEDLLYRWRSVGDNSNIPVQKGSSSYYADAHLDSRYESGDYINLRDVSLGYNFGKDFCESAGIERAKISLQLTNLFTLTKYSGIDVLTRGSFGYPIPRTYKVNLSVSF